MNKKLLLPIIVVVVIGIAAGAYFFLSGDKETPTVAFANYTPGESFVTNVKRTETNTANRLLKSGVAVVMDERLYNTVIASEDYYQPIIRDTVIIIMRKLTEAEISDTEGEDLIRQALVDALNERLDLNRTDETGAQVPHVYDVLFTDFVMQ